MHKSDIKQGQFVKHKKGGEYFILGFAIHTETSSKLVLYSPVDSPELIWARPLVMFLDGRFEVITKTANYPSTPAKSSDREG